MFTKFTMFTKLTADDAFGLSKIESHCRLTGWTDDFPSKKRLYCVCYIALRFPVKQNKGLSWMCFGINRAIFWLVQKNPWFAPPKAGVAKPWGTLTPPLAQTAWAVKSQRAVPAFLNSHPCAKSAKGQGAHSMEWLTIRGGPRPALPMRYQTIRQFYIGKLGAGGSFEQGDPFSGIARQLC
jgi:hypothetical protein